MTDNGQKPPSLQDVKPQLVHEASAAGIERANPKVDRSVLFKHWLKHNVLLVIIITVLATLCGLSIYFLEDASDQHSKVASQGQTIQAVKGALGQANDRIQSLGGRPVPTPTIVNEQTAPDITKLSITAGHFVATYANGSTRDLGVVQGLPEGPSGASGSSGASGKNGSNATGASGQPGPSGRPGANGKNGATGQPGPSGANGENGRSITQAFVTEDGVLRIQYSDGTDSDAGTVIGPRGPQGIGIKTIGIDDANNLVVTYTDGTQDTVGPIPVGPSCPDGYAQTTVTPNAIDPGTTWVVCQNNP